MTCAEIRAKLVSLLEDRDSAFTDWVNADAEIRDDPSHKNYWEAQKTKAKEAMDAIDAQLPDLKNQFEAQCILKQPQQILEIQYTNPRHPGEVDALEAQAVAYGRQDPKIILGGPFPSRDAKQEWKQVLPLDLSDTAAHDADYEGSNLVGCTGWALQPEFSGGDLPFDHPFGFDWEFMLALDQPTDDPNRYTFLLTPADQSCAEEGYLEAVHQADNLKIDIPHGSDNLPSLLGVEIDSGLVPQRFRDPYRGGVVQGDRMAVFGRWIVDCGHQMKITMCPEPQLDVHPGILVFRTEIHPPLFMAAARVTTGSVRDLSAPNSPELTRALFTSRPYLVSQRYTTDTSKIYNDSAADDGPFVVHMEHELEKALTVVLSSKLEAHPKIKSYPFQGSHEFHLIVRPPAPPGVGPIGIVLPHGPLSVSYQFTVRSGCNVQVIPRPGADSVEVIISLNHDRYTPPPLPGQEDMWQNGRVWTKEHLYWLDKRVAEVRSDLTWLQYLAEGIFGDIAGIVADADLERIKFMLDDGILTEQYKDVGLSAEILDVSRAVTAYADQLPTLPPGQGVMQNDGQPFPILGWLELYWTQEVIHP